ncbi:unnamed protein product, partial [Mesorhabditis belari]|uniref:Uncharacterized protein n=1 Tax=Mesorhabditis belari TaxID=2138241 RepID=A0AAF3EDK0_9BILA
MNRVIFLFSALCLLFISSSSAAPTADKSMVRKVETLKSASRTDFEAKKRRRAKRAVLVEELPIETEVDDDETNDQIDQIDQQLAGLSNDELEMLGQLVQNQVDTYDPELEEYEIIRIPRDVLMNDLDDDNEVNYFPRDRRSIPIEVEDDEEGLIDPQIVLVDEAQVEEALENARRDELELRERIAELAGLLNERALRGLSR